MTKTVTARPFADSTLTNRLGHRALHHTFVKVMPSTFTGLSIDIRASRWENPLPGPLARRCRIFPIQRVRQLDRASSGGKVAAMNRPHALEVRRQWFAHRLCEDSHAILCSFPPSDSDLAAIQVDILHPEGEAFEETHTAAIEQHRHDARDAIEFPNDCAHLALAQYDRQSYGSTGLRHVPHSRERAVDDVSVEELESCQRLGLCRRSEFSIHHKMREKSQDLVLTHLSRVAESMIAHKSVGPVHVRLFGATAEMPEPQFRAQGMQ
jgi:hypothetical protein